MLRPVGPYVAEGTPAARKSLASVAPMRSAITGSSPMTCLISSRRTRNSAESGAETSIVELQDFTAQSMATLEDLSAKVLDDEPSDWREGAKGFHGRAT